MSLIPFLAFSPEELAPLHKPVMDPYVRFGTVRLKDRDGVSHPVNIILDDVILGEKKGKLTLSRLGIINALLDQAMPGLRLVAYVPGPDGDDKNCGLYLEKIR